MEVLQPIGETDVFKVPPGIPGAEEIEAQDREALEGEAVGENPECTMVADVLMPQRIHEHDSSMPIHIPGRGVETTETRACRRSKQDRTNTLHVGKTSRALSALNNQGCDFDLQRLPAEVQAISR
jgi:hypothetical protein